VILINGGFILHIIIVSNYKRKAIIFILVLIFWFLLFSLSNFILKDKLAYHLTIDNYLSFSYPLKYKIDDVYVNKNLRYNAIQTNVSFKRVIIQNYMNFESQSGKFGFSYPSSFILNQRDFSGSDILYHIDFHNSSNSSHGFVQVWHLPYDLADFLKKSKAASLQNYLSFTSKPVNINNLPGYLWDYTVKTDDSNIYKGMEVFLKKDSRMYRISYFTLANLWNKDQSDIFWSMVNSLKTK
jgi:hypothetical protein